MIARRLSYARLAAEKGGSGSLLLCDWCSFATLLGFADPALTK